MKGIVYILRSREPSNSDGQFVYKYGRTKDKFSLKDRIFRASGTHKYYFDESLKFELIYSKESKNASKSESWLNWSITANIKITINEFFPWPLTDEARLFKLADEACEL